MRVPSFVFALLAVTGFVAAAPSALPAPTTALTSCAPSTGSGNDTALAPIIQILTNATTEIRPLGDQLNTTNSGTPDVNTVSAIIVEINAVITTTISQLGAVDKIDLSTVDLTNLDSVICALLDLVCDVLCLLVGIVIVLAGNVGALKTVISDLLNTVTSLVNSLQPFVDASLGSILGPVVTLVGGVVTLILKVVIGVSVSA